MHHKPFGGQAPHGLSGEACGTCYTSSLDPGKGSRLGGKGVMMIVFMKAINRNTTVDTMQNILTC